MINFEQNIMGCIIYSVSEEGIVDTMATFTENIYIELKKWERILEDSDSWLTNSTQQEIIDLINDQKKICTPGFILRRQIQIQFKNFMAAAAKNSGIDLNLCKNLQEAGNVSWDENFVAALAQILENATFENYDTNQKLLNREQWFNYLTDRTNCNRKLAIKLIFALKMDEETCAKFLIATDNTLLSARNPFDYIYSFCLTCSPRLSYMDAAEILDAFEKERKVAFDEKAAHDKTGTTTDTLISAMRALAQNVNISATAKKTALKNYMLQNAREFVNKVPKKNQKSKDGGESKYSSGFSFRNVENLKKLMEYLSLLYPTEIILGPNGEEIKIFLKVHNGRINVRELIQAMYYAQDIELREPSELNLPAKGSAKNRYDEVPFNNVVLQFKTLTDTLCATIRSGMISKNTKDISRSTIMILAYFFITGYLYADCDTASTFKARLKQDKNLPNTGDKKLIEALIYGIKNLDACKNLDEPIHIYIAALNFLLISFDFNKFYPPFVLDRLIILALLANPLNAPPRDTYENSLRFLFQCIIDKNYQNRLNKISADNQTLE